MNLINRIIRLEKDLNVNDDEIYIHVGDPCFTLYGAEAKEYIAQEQAAGRLLNPQASDGINGYRNFTLYLPQNWRDEQC